jgi:hypothetical protein
MNAICVALPFVKAAVRVLAFSAVVAGGVSTLIATGGGGGPPPPQTTELRVQSTAPADRATNVPVATVIGITFSEPISPSLAIAVLGPAGNLPGTISVNGATATFTASASLAHNSTYFVGVAGATGLSGSVLPAAFGWSFTTVAAPAGSASIALSASSRAFAATQGGANPPSQSVTITNGGAGTLSGLSLGAVAYGAGAIGWLQAPTLNATTAPATLTVQPVTGSLLAGTYTASIAVLAPLAANSPQSLSVTFTVAAPAASIVLTPSSRTFAATQGGASPANQTIAIANGGGGTLSGLNVGAVSYGAGASGWLGIPTLNTTTAPATLTLQPVTAGLTLGTYTATVAVLSAGAANSPQSVAVTFTVTAPALPPAISLSATSRAFTATQAGANPSSQSVTISNGGGGTLSGLNLGTVTYGPGAAGWLQPLSLSAATAPATLGVQPLTGSLSAGTYTATIPVLSSVAANSPQLLTVTFTVAAPAATIVLAPTSRAFAAAQGGTNPPSQTISITNGGGGALSGLSVGTVSYSAGANGWLQNPTFNTTATPATLTIQPLTGALTTGTYTATIPVQSASAGNSPQTVSVTFTVAVPPAAIALSASALSFGATQGGSNPPLQTVSIVNSGTGTLSGLSLGTIAYGSGAAGWIQAATLSSVIAPATLSVQLATGTLSPGTYVATIPVQSLGASNSPQNIGVTFNRWSSAVRLNSSRFPTT